MVNLTGYKFVFFKLLFLMFFWGKQQGFRKKENLQKNRSKFEIKNLIKFYYRKKNSFLCF